MYLSDTQVINLYHCGKSCSNIAFLDNCSETTIYTRLKSLGITMRSRSKANQIFPNSVFISLYNLGLSTSQVGKLLGVDPSTVTKRLHTLKFPLRSRCVASRIRYSEEEFQKHFMLPVLLDELRDM